jgi:hypothetical protein
MQSLQGSELRVSDEGLHLESGLCGSLAGKLADNRPPAEAFGLASALAVNAFHARIAAVGVRCSLRVQSTGAKLATAASRFTENEADSAASLQAIATPRVA